MRHSGVGGGGGGVNMQQLPLSVLPNNDHSVLPDTIFSRKKIYGSLFIDYHESILYQFVKYSHTFYYLDCEMVAVHIARP